jgi:quaternary ammonium compound-resistance protein SugE
MNWIYLVLAGGFEVLMALSLGASQNFTRPLPTVGFLIFSVISFSLLALAMKTIPIGTAYGVWTGIGAAGTAILGIVFLKEPASAARLFFLVLLIGSVIGLKATSTH